MYSHFDGTKSRKTPSNGVTFAENSMTEKSRLLSPKRLSSSSEGNPLEDSQRTRCVEQADFNRENGKRVACKTSACILFMELCERMSFFSITANLVLFLRNHLHFTSVYADAIVTAFMGTSYFVPIFGGWLADAIAGKFNVIYGCGLMYIVGISSLFAASISYVKTFGPEYCLTREAKIGYFVFGLSLVAVASGGIKTNVAPYGADQVEKSGPAAVETFFLWFYWFINVGSLIAFSAVAYIQQNISFCIGFIVPCVSMILALTVFRLGLPNYINTKPAGSILTTAAGAVCQGIRRHRSASPVVTCFIDAAKTNFGGTYTEQTVEGVKAIARIMPIFLTFIMYWAIGAQVHSSFYTQTLHMDLHLGSVKLPAASLNIFTFILILILIPFMDRLIYPFLQKHKKHPTLLQKIGVGLLLAGASVAAAGILEMYRKEELQASGGVQQIVGGRSYNASTMTMFYQVPQFLLFGASEVFASIASLELAYNQSPSAMKGLVTSLALLMNGIGNYCSSLVILIVQVATKDDPWFTDNINNGHLERVFFLFATLMAVNFVAFGLISHWYRYVPRGVISGSWSSLTTSGGSSNGSLLTTPKPSVSEFVSDRNEFSHL